MKTAFLPDSPNPANPIFSDNLIVIPEFLILKFFRYRLFCIAAGCPGSCRDSMMSSNTA
jgi:hypothetical protein